MATGSARASWSATSPDRDRHPTTPAQNQTKGVRCWFAPHDMKIGAKILGTRLASAALPVCVGLRCAKGEPWLTVVSATPETKSEKILRHHVNAICPVRSTTAAHSLDRVREGRVGRSARASRIPLFSRLAKGRASIGSPHDRVALMKSRRSSSAGGFSSTLVTPSSAARATMAGEGELVIRRIGMPDPFARSRLASSMPDISGM